MERRMGTSQQTLEKAIVKRITVGKPNRTSKNRMLIAGGIVGAGLTLAGAWGVRSHTGKEGPSPPQTQSVGSFPNSFNKEGSKIIDGRERFDNTAKRGVISEKNTIQMTPEEYKKIAPPLIDSKNPERMNILFPVQLSGDLEGRAIKIRRHGDWMGGGSRKINPKVDSTTQRSTHEGELSLKNSLTVEDGLKEGDILVSPVSGTISSGLTITGQDETGNTFGIMMGGRFDLQLIKDISPSRIEEFEPGKFRAIESQVPIEQGEIIGIIRKPSKGPLGMGGAGGNGQFQMLTFSTVVKGDGIQQVGAAETVVNISPDGKLITLK